MILHALVRYYDLMAERNSVSPIGWIDKMVNWALEIDVDGKIKGVHPIRRVMSIPFPARASSDITANLLCDDGRYFLGFNDKGKIVFPSEKFEKSKELHVNFLKSMESLEAKAICKFYSSWEQSYGKYSSIVSQLPPKESVVFLVGDRFALEVPEIKQGYDAYYRESNATGEKCRCLVSGNVESPCRIHPANFNIPGGTNPRLVSFDKDTESLYSFGTDGKQALCVPIGNITAQKYGNALRYLLNSKCNQFTIGKGKLIFWSEIANEVDESIFQSCLEPENESAPITDSELWEIVHKILTGSDLDVKAITESEDNSFYIAYLHCVSKGRIAVELFLNNSFGNFINNICLHQKRVALQTFSGKKRSLTLFVFCTAFMEELPKEIDIRKVDAFTQQLYIAAQRAVLTDSPYPYALYRCTMHAVLSAEKVNEKLYERVAVIKAILIKNNGYRLEEGYMSSGQPNAYYLGALFATIEEAKQASEKDFSGYISEDGEKDNESGSSLKRAYFNAACTAPQTVFPKLVTKLMPHYQRIIARTRPAYAKALENAMGEIHEHISQYPAHHSSEEQGLFIIGYYQRKAFRKKVSQKRCSKNLEEDVNNE